MRGTLRLVEIEHHDVTHGLWRPCRCLKFYDRHHSKCRRRKPEPLIVKPDELKSNGTVDYALHRSKNGKLVPKVHVHLSSIRTITLTRNEFQRLRYLLKIDAPQPRLPFDEEK